MIFVEVWDKFENYCANKTIPFEFSKHITKKIPVAELSFSGLLFGFSSLNSLKKHHMYNSAGRRQPMRDGYRWGSAPLYALRVGTRFCK